MCPFLLHGQSSLDFSGWQGSRLLKDPAFSAVRNGSYLNSQVSDFALSASFGSEFSPVTYNSVNYIAAAKRFSKHFLYLSYSPGIVKEFHFSGSGSMTGADSINSELENQLTYNEVSAFAYSYAFTENLSAGFAMRYFREEFINDVLGVVFTSDTLYLFRDSETEKLDLFKADIGLNYYLTNKLNLALLTNNLFKMESGIISETNKDYLLRKKRSVALLAKYNYDDAANLHSAFETNGFFSFAVNKNTSLFGGTISYGAGYFDFLDDTKLSGFIPSVSYQSGSWGISVSGVKYLNRPDAASLSDFSGKGVSDLSFNIYSSDKVTASLFYEINTSVSKYAAFDEVRIKKNIYTGLGDIYSTEPFATARVYNFSDEAVTVKPSSKIEGINNSEVFSEPVRIEPGDTITVNFYTFVNEKLNISVPQISTATFMLYTHGEKPDDSRSTPLLVYGKNAWDGNVGNLRNYATDDAGFSLELARGIIAQNKNLFDTLSGELSNFYKIKIIYSEVVKQLVYVADPNAATDRVQYPNETIKLKGGDCDDLSVLFSSLFESIGLETAFVDYKSDSGAAHVNVLVNTGLNAEYAASISENDRKYYIRKDISGAETVWLPVETTVLTGFGDAWNAGALKFYNEAILQYGLLKNKVEIFEVF